MSGVPYTSSEDSRLLRRVLSSYSGKACLEIGAGNGGNLIELSKRFETIVGTDIVEPAVRDWTGVGSFILTDGASCIRPDSFDLVAFNPPYLMEEIHDRATQGGAHLEVPKRFLREALRVVKEDGSVVFLLSDSADVQEFRTICQESGFDMTMKESARGFFEELSVYAARASRPRLQVD